MIGCCRRHQLAGVIQARPPESCLSPLDLLAIGHDANVVLVEWKRRLWTFGFESLTVKTVKPTIVYDFPLSFTDLPEFTVYDTRRHKHTVNLGAKRQKRQSRENAQHWFDLPHRAKIICTLPPPRKDSLSAHWP